MVDEGNLDQHQVKEDIAFSSPTPALLSQANPVQNTWYTVLDTTRNVRLIYIMARINDTNEDLQVKLTIDGRTITWTKANAVAGQNNNCYLLGSAAVGESPATDTSGTSMPYVYAPMEGKSVKVEIRKTSAAGVPGPLVGAVVYAKRGS